MGQNWVTTLMIERLITLLSLDISKLSIMDKI